MFMRILFAQRRRRIFAQTLTSNSKTKWRLAEQKKGDSFLIKKKLVEWHVHYGQAI